MVIKALAAIAETGLGVTTTEIMFCDVVRRKCCLLCDALFAALSLKRAVGFDCAVARWYDVVEVGYIF